VYSAPRQLKIVSKKSALDFSEAAKPGNVILQAYENLNIELLSGMVPRLIRDLRTFTRAIKKLL